LAIETSCDDTAVAVLRRNGSNELSADETTTRSHTLLFNERITSDHRQFGGIMPPVAVQGHTSALAPLLRRAIAHLPDAAGSEIEEESDVERGERRRICWTEDGRAKQMPDFISVTRGPGIMPNLSVGLSMAKGLAVAWDVPIVGVHHMQAHALTPRLVTALGLKQNVAAGAGAGAGAGSDVKERTSGRYSGLGEPSFPFLSLLVSGGHTQLVHSQSLTSHSIIATTADVAIGNLLDHSARSILPDKVLASATDVMYGRLLESFAFPEGGTPEEYAFYQPATCRADEIEDQDTGYAWKLPSPLKQSRKLAYSFSGLGTSVGKITSAKPLMDEVERRVLARHTMAAAFRHLVGRLCIALEDVPDLNRAQTLVVAGGVACNRFLMHVLQSTLAVRGYGHLDIMAPPPSLCTDNAAMIAWTGMEMFEDGWETDLDMLAIHKWPMDPEHGIGILGAPGWKRRAGYGS
jgi:N6-L-threonylcarbamoyladenine synthase